MSNTQYFTLFLVGMLMLIAMMIAAVAWLEYDGWQAVVIALPACRCEKPLFFIKADVRGGHAALFGSLFDVHLLHLRPYITP